MMYEVSSSGPREAASLEDYLSAIRDRARLILLCAAIGLVGAYLLASNRTPQFEAVATVVANPSPAGSTLEGRLVEANLDREVEILVSDSVARAAVEIMGSEEDPLPLRLDLEVEFVPDSDILQVGFTDPDAQRSADVVNAFAEAYVEQRVREQLDFYDLKIAGLEETVATLEVSVDDQSRAVGLLDAEREELLAEPDENASLNRSRLDSIAAERSTLLTDQNSSLLELRNLRVDVRDLTSDRNSEVPSAVVLSEALVPTIPQGLSNPTLSLAGLLAGLLFGIVWAFVSSRLDRSADSEEEVSAALGTGVLGSIPNLGWRNSRGAAALAMMSQQRSMRIHRAKESYRRLRTSIEFLSAADHHKTFLVTSSHPGEGKTVTASNLAVALASGGQQVVLINADMRRPRIENLFGVKNGANGLSAFLGGMTDSLDPIPVEGLENLFIVPSGPSPANPGELLASDRFELLIKEVSSQADIVVVDTPPVAATADAGAAASAVDAVIVVVDAKSTSLDELRVTRADLERAGANVVGAIMNRDETRDSGLFGRRNAYAYGRADAA